jgi:hypothetical protein
MAQLFRDNEHREEAIMRVMDGPKMACMNWTPMCYVESSNGNLFLSKTKNSDDQEFKADLTGLLMTNIKDRTFFYYRVFGALSVLHSKNIFVCNFDFDNFKANYDFDYPHFNLLGVSLDVSCIDANLNYQMSLEDQETSEPLPFAKVDLMSVAMFIMRVEQKIAERDTRVDLNKSEIDILAQNKQDMRDCMDVKNAQQFEQQLNQFSLYPGVMNMKNNAYVTKPLEEWGMKIIKDVDLENKLEKKDQLWILNDQYGIMSIDKFLVFNLTIIFGNIFNSENLNSSFTEEIKTNFFNLHKIVANIENFDDDIIKMTDKNGIIFGNLYKWEKIE